MTSTYDYVIVGDGIAARCVLYYMSLCASHKESSILQISEDTFFNACSLRTTSVVSKDLHKKGISELGDLICDSLIAFETYIDSNNPLGVHKASQYTISKDPANNRLEVITQKFNRSVGQNICYQINAHVFLSDLKTRAIANLKRFIFKNDVCVQIDKTKNLIKTRNNEDVLYRNLILCTGAYTHLLTGPIGLKNINDGKPVAGSYYQWENVEFEESFVLTKGHFNIIYRKFDKTLLFGGTSFEGLVFINNQNDLSHKYADLCSEFQSLNFPSIDSAQIITGIRHKGKKRMPQLLSDGNIHILNSLYKNGFTFPFYLAQKLVNSICN